MASSSSLKTLTGIRGVVALWVMLSHLVLLPAYNAGFGERLITGPLYAPLQFVFSAVDVLLVLSGFFLYRNYRDYFTPGTRGWKMDKFYLARAAKLWPMHALMVGVIGLYEMLGIGHNTASANESMLMQYWPLTLVLNLLMMHAWGFVPGASWNEPAWTISALFFVYMIFPVWIGLVQRSRTRARQWAGIVFFLLLLEIVPRFVPGLSMADGFGCLLRTFCLFMMGCFAFRLYEGGAFSGRHADYWRIAFAAMLYAGMHVFIYVQTFPLIFMHLLYVPFLLALAASTGVVRRAMSGRALMWLGTISYSYYMLHYPFLLLVKHLFGEWYALLHTSQPLLWAHAALLALAIAVLSWLCWRFIEVPCANWARGRLQLRD